jgi:hypothetical protein
MGRIESEQLCTYCGRACGGCTWSDGLEPVSGWEAEESKIGWHVTACPKYRSDSRIRVLDTSGVILLVEAIGRQLKEDYVRGRFPYEMRRTAPNRPMSLDDVEIYRAEESRERARRQIERWLTRGEGKTIFQVSDPASVIRELRKAAAEHDRKMGWDRANDEWRRDLP